MLLPTSNTAVMLVLFAGAFLLGLWANTQKAAGKYRFELYYYDFGFGALLCSLLLAYTVGVLGPEVTFEDNLLITGRKQIALALAAGFVYNLGNIMLAAGISVAGMAAATTVAMGMMYASGNFFNAAMGVQMQQSEWVAACLAAAAVGTGIAAVVDRANASDSAFKHGLRGVILSVVCGLFFSLSESVAATARAGEIGIGPLGLSVFVAVGMVASTLVYNLYFLNLPVSGKPVSFRHYMQATRGQHFWGLLGGMVWACGFTAIQISGAAPRSLQPAPELRSTWPAAAGITAALCGLALWKEFPAGKPRLLFLATAVLLAAVLAANAL
jgi:glucose uptake protein